MPNIIGFKGDQLPKIVRQHAEEDKMTPIAWVIHPDRVVIVYQEGPKMGYARQADQPPARHSDDTNRPSAKVVDDSQDIPSKTPIIHNPPTTIAPTIQKLPVKRRK